MSNTSNKKVLPPDLNQEVLKEELISNLHESFKLTAFDLITEIRANNCDVESVAIYLKFIFGQGVTAGKSIAQGKDINIILPYSKEYSK